MSILEHKKNVSSQNGEDGIIEYIFKKMGLIKKGNFIEFGAWDGTHLSNAYQLFQRYSWSGIYIEMDSHKFYQLENNFKHFEDITCIKTEVGFDKHNKLDTIIDESDHKNKEFDFVSIDVDGLDFWIFQKMEKYLPKVICIEVNAGHSPNFDQLVPMGIAKHNIGQSILVISKEAEKKGYFPLCYTGNLFLVKNEYKHLFQEHIKSFTEIYEDFLKYLDKSNPGGVEHLYNKFVKNHQYGEYFINPELREFTKNLQQSSDTNLPETS